MLHVLKILGIYSTEINSSFVDLHDLGRQGQGDI